MAPSRRRCLAPIILGVAIIGPFGPATAQDIVYTPSNPSFGGNPFNSAHLLGVASAQNKYRDPNATTSTDPAQQFLRTLQSRLLSSLAPQLTDLIFGEIAQDSEIGRASCWERVFLYV